MELVRRSLMSFGITPSNNRLKLTARGTLTAGKQRRRSHAAA
jgi:hypothetical protein